MRQNLVRAAGYNVFAIPLAAGILVRTGVLLSPAVGAILMSANIVIVVVNAQFSAGQISAYQASKSPSPSHSHLDGLRMFLEEPFCTLSLNYVRIKRCFCVRNRWRVTNTPFHSCHKGTEGIFY